MAKKTSNKDLEKITEIEFVEHLEQYIDILQDEQHDLYKVYKQYLRDKDRYKLEFFKDKESVIYKKYKFPSYKPVGYNRKK